MCLAGGFVAFCVLEDVFCILEEPAVRLGRGLGRFWTSCECEERVLCFSKGKSCAFWKWKS